MQQGVARTRSQILLLHLDVEQDLDVDLVIRTVHARRVIDGIRVQPSSGQGIFDAPALRRAKVCTLAQHTRTYLGPVYAHRVIGAIARVRIAFVLAFHIGADAAKPQQVDLHLQDQLDQFVGGQFVHRNAKHLFDFRRQRHPLGAAFKDSAALGQQFGVVIRPARARQIEQALTLFQRFRRAGCGVDENVYVVERRHQTNVVAEQHAVAKHIA